VRFSNIGFENRTRLPKRLLPKPKRPTNHSPMMSPRQRRRRAICPASGPLEIPARRAHRCPPVPKRRAKSLN